MNNLPDILTMKEVTELLRITRQTVVKEIESKNLKAMKIGRQYRFKKCDIIDYMNKSAENK